MPKISDLEKEIEKIKQRNAKVEADKAWETSNARKIIIAVLTYFVIVIFFYFVGLQNPIVSAIVPAIAFVLSNLSIPALKNYWLKKFYKK